MTMRSPAPLANGDPEAVIDAVLSARDSGRAADALPLLRSALAAHPRNARLWQVAGLIHRALEDSAAAVEAFAAAARLAPTDIKIAHGLAQASLEAGRPATALFDRVRSLAPSDGSILLGRAAAQLAEGQLQAAIDDLDAIVGANPGWRDGQATLVRLRWMMDDEARCTQSYRRALAATPSDPGLWVELLDRLIEADRFESAAETLAEATVAIGAHEALLPYEAICASELGRADEADRLFALLAPRNNVAITERHVRHLLRSGRPADAVRVADPWLADERGARLWPFLAIAWRLTADPRSDWLEGQQGLVGVYDLGIDALLGPLAERLRALHLAKRAPLGQSVRGGTQTDGPLLAREEPEIRALRAILVETVEGHIAGMGAQDARHPVLRHLGKGFRFSGSWSVRLAGAGHHTNHIHPQGWLSSALYVSLPPAAEMGPPPSGWLQLGRPPEELALDMPALREVEPRPGRLVLFPSMMWHGTVPFHGGERLTVAFDVVPARG
jgi:tetratricopeptide (TPR) repeat protein